MNYIIVKCTKCGRFFIKHYGIKTATCPYCGKRISVKGSFRTFTDIRDAQAFLKSIKSQL